MQLIKSINLMENKKLILWLNVASLIIVMPFVSIFTLIASIQPESSIQFEFN